MWEENGMTERGEERISAKGEERRKKRASSFALSLESRIVLTHHIIGVNRICKKI